MSPEQTTSRQRAFKTQGRSWWASRLLSIALGLILLTASLLKATDMELFIRQIRDYGILSDPLLLTLSAWGLIALECTLGVGLLVFYRPKLILSLAALLLLVFIGATSWAWLNSTAEACGCFGAFLRHTPGEAALGNLILFAAAVFAWASLRPREMMSGKVKSWALLGACLFGLALPLAFGFSPTQFSRSPWKSLEKALSDLQIQGIDRIDLGHGAYLIILMDTDCSHCQEAIPELNALAEDKDLPRVIMLCMNDEGQRMRFVEEFEPISPFGEIREEAFSRLLGLGDLPRTILVRDKRVIQVWDKEVPDKHMIEAARSN